MFLGLAMMREVVFRPIGVVHSPFLLPQNIPIQSAAAKWVVGSVEFLQDYMEGLKDVEGIISRQKDIFS